MAALVKSFRTCTYRAIQSPRFRLFIRPRRCLLFGLAQILPQLRLAMRIAVRRLLRIVARPLLALGDRAVAHKAVAVAAVVRVAGRRQLCAAVLCKELVTATVAACVREIGRAVAKFADNLEVVVAAGGIGLHARLFNLLLGRGDLLDAVGFVRAGDDTFIVVVVAVEEERLIAATAAAAACATADAVWALVDDERLIAAAAGAIAACGAVAARAAF